MFTGEKRKVAAVLAALVIFAACAGGSASASDASPGDPLISSSFELSGADSATQLEGVYARFPRLFEILASNAQGVISGLKSNETSDLRTHSECKGVLPLGPLSAAFALKSDIVPGAPRGGCGPSSRTFTATFAGSSALVTMNVKSVLIDVCTTARADGKLLVQIKTTYQHGPVWSPLIGAATSTLVGQQTDFLSAAVRQVIDEQHALQAAQEGAKAVQSMEQKKHCPN